jgi:hypothetical protein
VNIFDQGIQISVEHKTSLNLIFIQCVFGTMPICIVFYPICLTLYYISPLSANDVIILAHYGYSRVAYIQDQSVGRPGLRIAESIYLVIGENNA